MNQPPRPTMNVCIFATAFVSPPFPLSFCNYSSALETSSSLLFRGLGHFLTNSLFLHSPEWPTADHAGPA